MLTKERLEAIRKRARRATAGPWFVSGDGVIKSQTVVDHKYEEPVEIAEVSFDCNDEGFIAHARQDIPDLLAEVERLKESVEIEKIAKRDIVEEIFGDKIRESAEILAEEIRKKFGNGGDIDD